MSNSIPQDKAVELYREHRDKHKVHARARFRLRKGSKTLMRRLVSLFVISFFTLNLITNSYGADPIYSTNNGNFNITYTDNVADYPDNCTSAEIAAFGNILEGLRTLYITNFGLIAPSSPLPVEMKFQLINGHGGFYGMDFDPYFLGPRWLPSDDKKGGVWPPPIFWTPTTTVATSVGGHELFHVIQYQSYGATNPNPSTIGWIIEGQARMMQDKMSLALDQNSFDMSNYYDECKFYLQNPDRSLLTYHNYSACLFWNYITEKYGGMSQYFLNEPQRGVDIISEFWDQANAVSRVDGIDTVNKALTTLGHTVTFEDVFRDFIVANYLKDLTGNVPSKYKYVDETQPPGHYDYDNNPATPAVPLAADRLLGASQTYTNSDTVNAWAAKYYRIMPSNDSLVINVKFTQSTSDLLSYDMLAIDGGNLVNEYRVKSKDFVKSIINLDYDEIVLVVGGLENEITNPASYSYTFSTGEAKDISFSIQSPVSSPTSAHARVGSHNDPEKLLSVVEVLFKGSPILGLNRTNFRSIVGQTEATIDTVGYVLGSYFILIQAPAQQNSGSYDLRVGLDPFSITGVDDVEAHAVDYDGLAADNVLVIDKSGSMSGPLIGASVTYGKINAAKLAAKLYADSFLTGDKICVVSFSETASLDVALQDLSDAYRTYVKDQVDLIQSFGLTSIGGGLKIAQDQLYSLGQAGHGMVIVLLSDGGENTPPMVNEVLQTILGNGTTVHTVAIGEEADVVLMRNIASATGGMFNFAQEPASGDLPNDLTDIYRWIVEEVRHEQRIITSRGSGGYWYQKVPIDRGSKEATFTFSYNASHPISGSVELLTPTGVEIQPSFLNYSSTPTGVMGYVLWRVQNPEPGDYVIRGEGPFINNFLIEASIKHDLTMKLYFPRGELAQRTVKVVGEPISILVNIAQRGPVKGANVTAYIITPKALEVPSQIHQVKLFDDGAHGDGEADDGIYGNLYTQTSQNGTYIVKALANGSTTLTGDFRREARGAFYIGPDEDSDNDGLPNTWERQNGLDLSSLSGDDGGQGDPDNDGLLNIDEYRFGTNPKDPDTDGGGENDYSEIVNARDPTDPSDDTIKPPATILVLPGNNFVTIFFSLGPFDHLILYRSEHSDSEYAVIDSLVAPIGVYNDTEVRNGVTYYYKLVAVNERRAISGLTHWVTCTPHEDTEPPEGAVIINRGEIETYSIDVTLSLFSSNDTTEMMISNGPAFIDTKWEPYMSEKIWKLGDAVGIQTVFVKFKDWAGNLGSNVAHDSIKVTLPSPTPTPSPSPSPSPTPIPTPSPTQTPTPSPTLTPTPTQTPTPSPSPQGGGGGGIPGFPYESITLGIILATVILWALQRSARNKMRMESIP